MHLSTVSLLSRQCRFLVIAISPGVDTGAFVLPRAPRRVAHPYPYLPHTHRTTHASITRSRYTALHETPCDIP
nr:MAG TPA: hypothetical protein [Caudoviricetes sp.]